MSKDNTAEIFTEEEYQRKYDSSLGVVQELTDKFKHSLPEAIQVFSDYNAENEISSAGKYINDERVMPAGKINPAVRHEAKINTLQEWVGVVIKIKKDSFLARLEDMTEKGPDEEAEFAIEELHADDKELLAEGAIFYWSIIYQDLAGQRTRVSLIRFQRLPRWGEGEIEQAKRKAKNIKDLLDWNPRTD